MALNDVSQNRENRYYVVVKTEADPDKWDRSDAWGWWDDKEPAIRDALDKTNRGAWGYRVLEAEVRHTLVTSVTETIAVRKRVGARIEVQTDESK